MKLVISDTWSSFTQSCRNIVWILSYKSQINFALSHQYQV